MHYPAFSLTMGTNHTFSLHHTNKPPNQPHSPGAFGWLSSFVWLVETVCTPSPHTNQLFHWVIAHCEPDKGDHWEVIEKENE